MNDQEFLEALAKFAPSVRQAFIDAVQDVTDNAILAQVVEALERGDEVAAWRALGYNPSVFNRLTSAIATAFEQGAIFTMGHLPKYVTDRHGVKSMLRFNMRDREAERWLAEQSSSLITKIEDDMRGAVRDTLQEGVAAGRNPRSIALDLVGRYNRDTGHREGGTVGLGDREQLWARNVRQRLVTLDERYFEMSLRDARFDATVRDAIDSGKPLSQDVVDRLVDRYRVRALQHRGETISRTETLSALNRSEYEAVRQSQAQTGLPDAAFTKEWDSAGDKRVRHSHVEMDGQKVLFSEPFVSPLTNARMMHPGDTSLGAPGKEVIGCRCRVKYRTDFAYGE